MEREHGLSRYKAELQQGVRGMNLKDLETCCWNDCYFNEETSVLTLSKYGMAKRSRLGDGKCMIFSMRMEPSSGQ
jgi:hypothetical protein